MKKISIKWKYVSIGSVIIISALLIWFVYNIYHRYSELYRLSGNINKYRDEISLEKINSQNPSDWKTAVVESDSILDDIFEKIGFKGKGLEEKLKSVEPSDFDNLQNIWDAHKTRNKIAHLGADFELTQEEAKSAVDNYEKGLKELRYI